MLPGSRVDSYDGSLGESVISPFLGGLTGLLRQR